MNGEPRPNSPPSTFWIGFWLAVAMVGSKAFDLGQPEMSVPALRAFASDLAVASHTDVLFAVAVSMAGGLLLRVAGRRPAIVRAIRVLLTVFGIVCVFYAVLSVQIFRYLRSPLTYALIYLAGDIKNMQSSVGAFATPSVVAALVLAPVVYAMLVRACEWLNPPAQTLGWRAVRALGALALVSYIGVAHQATLTSAWIDRPDRLVAENPHWMIASSYAAELLGGSTVRLEEAFPREDVDDFRIIAEQVTPVTATIPRHRPRNVILLVLESTATRYLSLYGSPYPTMPRLEAEAAHAVVFDDFYCHFGLSSHALLALTLSIYPGMTWHEYTVDQPDLPGTTLAELLHERGYRTAFIHSGDVDYGGQRNFLSHRGFDDLRDFRDLGCGPRQFSWGVEDRCLVNGLLQWIDENRSWPFYALAWTIQMHHPYPLSPGQVPIDFFHGNLPIDDYDLGNYLNVLHEVDGQIGRLLDGLRERGVADDTLVVITGDHGEAFGDPHETWGHGRRLFQENVNVPLMLWNPKMFHGARSRTIGGQVDLNPTIADLLGVPPAASWQGRSLFAPSRPPRAYFYAADHDYMLGVREHEWKYIYDAKRGREYLFDLAHDPVEKVNRAEENPDQCRRLRQRLSAWLQYEEKHLAGLRQAKR